MKEYFKTFDEGKTTSLSMSYNVSKFSTLNSVEFVSAVCKIDLDECFIDHQYYLWS